MNSLCSLKLHALLPLCVVILFTGAIEPVYAVTNGGMATEETASNSAGTDTEAPSRGVLARERLKEVIQLASGAPHAMVQTLRDAAPDGHLGWHVLSALVVLGCMFAGMLAARFTANWGRQHFIYLFNPNPATRADKLTYLLLRFFLMLLHVVVFVAVAGLAALAIDYGGRVGRVTAEIAITVAAVIWVVKVLFRNLFAPDAPSHRMLSLSDEDAVALTRSAIWAPSITIVAIGLCKWMDELGLDQNAHLLLLLMAMAIGAVSLTYVVIRHRKPIGAMLTGVKEESALGPAGRVFARTWHVLAVLYFVGAYSVSAVRLLLDLPSAAGLVVGPVVIGFAALGFYGIALLFIDKYFDRKPDRIVINDDDIERTDIVISEGDLPEKPPRTYKNLAEHASAVFIWALWMWSVLAMWGVDVHSGESAIVRLLDVALVVFLAYLGHGAIRVAVDQRIEEEGGMAMAEPGDEGGAAGGASRLATLLPLFRNFLTITVLTIAGMMVLSRLGVDIAPLFAGAGVIGLAVGFGAQALIRDIFSGAFFLFDDAFRRGEYIDVGGTKGTVENISLRSMQLRHHLGALHTIPFGEIKLLTNHSRDWAMMKLSLRVTYDTDVEHVRKLIKNLGKELMSHPEVGEKFLQPLKSQGVFSMEDSAMLLRVKFMTRPGDQFVVRKLVYQRVRELFAKEGIRFAHREVTVRVSPDEAKDPNAIAGAVAPSLESPAMAGGPADR